MEARGGIGPLFARWTTDFDCGYETQWWYVILDHKFDIDSIKAKHRYYIKQGIKNFDITRIEYEEYQAKILEIYNEIRIKSYELNKVQELKRPDNSEIYFGAFQKLSGVLAGYAVIREHKDYLELVSLKTLPQYEKYSINAAIIYTIICSYNNKLGRDFYISNGTRTINHPTNFNEYLERMFEFRKAYCLLRIRYQWYIKVIVNMLFYFKSLILKLRNKNNFFRQISAVLEMEEIRRECRKQ